jgi:hypothetical protein
MILKPIEDFLTVQVFSMGKSVFIWASVNRICRTSVYHMATLVQHIWRSSYTFKLGTFFGYIMFTFCEKV